MTLSVLRMTDSIAAVEPRMANTLSPEDLRAFDGVVRLARGDAAGAAERLPWSYYGGILAAHIQRGRTGEGSHIDVSMLEALGEWMTNPLYYAYEGAAPPLRSGASHPSIYPYGPFRTGDGKTVVPGLQNEREWEVFCREVLGQPELALDPRFSSNLERTANREELCAIIEAVFAPGTAGQVIARLDAAGIGNAAMNTMADVWKHRRYDCGAVASRWMRFPRSASTRRRSWGNWVTPDRTSRACARRRGYRRRRDDRDRGEMT
jgi:crotonobetainyl-CoA:carnitine CoA-transferase CaiB-like acyl-CoA transferase